MPERTKWNLIDLSSGGEALSLFLLATLHRHLRSSSLRYFNPRPQSEHRMPTGTNIRNELYEYVLFWKSYRLQVVADCSVAFSMQGFWLGYNWKHCQRHKGPKTLSTLTLKSTHLGLSRSFNKHWTLGQTSVWFCLAKGKKNKTTLTNPCLFNKSI